MNIMSLFMTVLTSSISKAARYQKMTVLFSFLIPVKQLEFCSWPEILNYGMLQPFLLVIFVDCFFFELGGCLMIKMTLGQLTFNAVFDDRYESRLYQYYL